MIMPIETCPHCFTSVIFNDTTTCPCCGKDKYSTAMVSKEEFEAQQQLEEKRIICQNLLKRARACLIIGGSLLFICVLSTLLSCLVGIGSTLFYTGIIASIVILLRGFKDIIERNRLKKACR